MADLVQTWVPLALLVGALLAALSAMLWKPVSARREEAEVGFRAECRACPLLREPPARNAAIKTDHGQEVRQCVDAAAVYRTQAVRDLAYDLQRARTEQALIAERMGIGRVVREKQIEVEDLEIERKSRELVHQVHRPADAERYRIETLAAADCRRRVLLAEGEAEAARLVGLAEAEVIRAKGEAEAEVIRQKALAEAEGVKARLLAEAEGMRHKAAAWEQYTGPAIAQILIEHLPAIAAAMARPLEGLDHLVVVNAARGECAGLESLVSSVLSATERLPGPNQGDVSGHLSGGGSAGNLSGARGCSVLQSGTDGEGVDG